MGTIKYIIPFRGALMVKLDQIIGVKNVPRNLVLLGIRMLSTSNLK